LNALGDVRALSCNLKSCTALRLRGHLKCEYGFPEVAHPDLCGTEDKGDSELIYLTSESMNGFKVALTARGIFWTDTADTTSRKLVFEERLCCSTLVLASTSTGMAVAHQN
jgi:hypothetical protein